MSCRRFIFPCSKSWSNFAMTLSIACPPIRKSAGIDRASRAVSLYNLRRQRGSEHRLMSAPGHQRTFGKCPQRVRFTPECGHCSTSLAGPLSAISGLRALGRLLAHIEKCTIARAPHRDARAPHRERSCMSGEGISTLAHRMINDVLRTSRRRFLTQVGAAGLGIGVPVSMTMAQETQRSLVGDGKEVSLGEKLARFATSLRYEDLPEDVIRIAKRTILDTLGCAFGGYSAGPSKIAMKLASDVNSKQPGTILLSGIKTSPELAVFANGVMIRYLDFNDAYVSQMNGAGHPSDTIATLLTAAELRQRSGRELITATVLAYEVFCKIADVFDYLGNGIDHTTVTGIGAVVGAGKLLGLTPEEMAHAIGITVGGNTATRQGRADTLSNWKAYAAADACRKAIFSLQLAQNGMTGPSAVFEGRYGFFKVMSRQPVQPPRLGEPYGIRRAFTKRFPLGQFSQTVAQAAVEARPLLKSPDDIQEVNIHVSHSAIKIMADGPDKWRPQTHEN